ncbi:hypothetical protein GCM10027347_17400 [Larkinella harenae]
MNLQTIIDEYEEDTLPSRTDSYLEKARLMVESAAYQSQFLPGLKHFRQTMLSIESLITRVLVTRYGCDD